MHSVVSLFWTVPVSSFAVSPLLFSRLASNALCVGCASAHWTVPAAETSMVGSHGHILSSWHTAYAVPQLRCVKSMNSFSGHWASHDHVTCECRWVQSAWKCTHHGRLHTRQWGAVWVSWVHPQEQQQSPCHRCLLPHLPAVKLPCIILEACGIW